MADDITPKRAQVSVSADVPEELLAAFVQHIRDFDAAHEGCDMKIAAMTEQGIKQIEQWLANLDPPFAHRKTFRKN